MIPRRWELRLAGVTLILLAALLVWNVFQFPWRKGYDATAAAHYAEVLGTEHRLPLRSETDVWHNPPLWFAIAGVTYRAGEVVGLGDPGIPVQLFSALCVLGIVLLTGVAARELDPDRRALVPLAILTAALTPVLVRAGVLFHPEPLAAFLTMAGLVVFIRAVSHGAPTLVTGAGVGALLGLANLTRTWALAALAAVVCGALVVAIRDRTRDARSFALAILVVSTLFVAPWLVVKASTYGSPFAYSQPDASQWRQHGRPASFWLGLDIHDVVSAPYQPSYRNQLIPTVFTDWFGDYWRSYDVPSRLKDEPDVLPPRWSAPLVRQSWVGFVVGVFVVFGAVGLVGRAWRRRDVALGTFLLSGALLGLVFVAFLLRYPKQDGDNIKALYLLNAAPVVALACAWGLAAVAGRGRIGLVVAGLALAGTGLTSLSFLTL